LLERAEYDRFRVAPTDPATLRARDVESIVKKLSAESADRLTFEKFDESLEGRPIYLITLGTGPRRVLLWSQMHGDEPTLTSVMLDLFSYLLQKPAAPMADEILSGCTLLFVPMLNPDGAEAVTRYNAQGIDINRDWRRQVTPEGRALLRAAKTLNAQFGFNLHNQNARTTVGRPPKPAAISVLAPAPDATRKVSPSMHSAKQMCTCFVEAVRPYAEGMISRYDDTHEPRAFGDGIQSLGIATMLVEAGGLPEADPEPMTRLHFHGMLNTLYAIATDKYRAADVQIYEDLPESNSTRANDLLITKANVLDAKVPKPFTADIVIDQSSSERLAESQVRDGKIIDIGDVPFITAKRTINAAKSLVLPGQIMLLRDWRPGAKLDDKRVSGMLAQGVTSLIGLVDLGDRDAIDGIAALQSLPFNWAFAAHADSLDRLKESELAERVAVAAVNGLLAVISDSTDETLWRHLHQFNVPLIKSSQISGKAADTYQELAKIAWSVANSVKLQGRRGRINRDYLADLLFFDDVPADGAAGPVDWKKLNRVMVAGEIVWENGEPTGSTPGTFVRHA